MNSGGGIADIGNARGIRSGGGKREGQVWKENFMQATQVIRTHKMRSGLLIVGVAVGVMTVLAIVTVMSGLSKRIREDFVSANRPYLVVTRFDPMQDERDRADVLRRKELTADDADAIAGEIDIVDRVDFEIDPGGRMWVLRYKGERTNLIQIVGVSYSFSHLFNIDIDEGRSFTEFEQDRKRRVIVLGYGPSKDLFPNTDPVGKFIRIDNHEYEVVGTFESRKHILGSLGDNFAIIPYSTFEKDMSGRFDENQIIVSLKPGFTLEEGEEEITALLRARRAVEPGEENDFHIMTSEAFKDLLSDITRNIALILVIISSIGLMVGGIGVMNIMLVSVTERTREVGVRMAVGAKRSDIMQQFLIEAATLTGSGGTIGIILGLLAARGIARLINFPYSIPAVWILVAFIFSASIGFIFGLYPANRAARMDPIKALHYE